MTEIPEGLAGVTTEWLADCLGKKPASMQVEPMGEGVGMMSSLARIHLTWPEGADMPKSLIFKFPAENENNRLVARQYYLYVKEVSYYRDLAPQTSAKSPKIYASELGDDQNFFLLMEDASDYRMGDQVTGASLEECQLCVDFLGKLHADFWGKVDDIAWLPNISGSDNARTLVLGCEAGWEQMLEYFGEQVPDSINERRADYLAAISHLQELLDQPPRTLVHGDFRMDNMLFGQTPEHEPLLVVDFQGPLKGNGMHDFAYLLSHSVQTEVRRNHEKALVQRYVEVLQAAGVRDYNFAKAWQDYRTGVLYIWTIAVVIAGTLDPSNDRGFAWMSKMVERNVAALEDLNCLALLDNI